MKLTEYGVRPTVERPGQKEEDHIEHDTVRPGHHETHEAHSWRRCWKSHPQQRTASEEPAGQ